ncbi:MAG: hypothetical protein E3J64_05350 [Anaerolineales bacterium]|nr:MAG: hypothetical protein E3J64_05350 [Anaerolineales bacterium]
MERLNVLGLDLYPALRFDYLPGYFGRVWFDGSLPDAADGWLRAAGSLSTLAVALLSQLVLWARPPRRRWLLLALIGFCFSWVDVFWHTALALLGWRGMMYAETYSALVALGAPGWLTAGAIFGVTAALPAATIVRLRRLARGRRASVAQE